MHRASKLAVVILLWVFLLPAALAQQNRWAIERPAASFDRTHVVKKEVLEQVRRNSNLAGAVGWFEYDVQVPESGWHEIILQGSGAEIEFLLDPRGDDPAQAKAYLPGSRGFDGKDDKLGNFWLDAGRHTLRLQRYYWTGFPQISGVMIRAATDKLSTHIRVAGPAPHGIFRKGECGHLKITHGPRATAAILPLQWVNASTFATLTRQSLTLPATRKQTVLEWPLPCSTEGHFVVYFNGGPDQITNRDLQPVSYEVIDTSSRPGTETAPRKVLVSSIDITATPPDYQSGDTRIIRQPFGSYRESGTRGWLAYQTSRLKLAEPNWFAYVLKDIVKQQPHLVEIDYPDDAERTFAIALRESDPLSYPVAGGVDSGGEFRLSHRMQTHTLLFWPRAAEPRIVFMPPRDGKTAAAARVRVYRIEGDLPPLVGRGTQGRSYANWYEEGSNFLSMYGAPNDSPHGTRVALERWARTAAYMGADTLWPTVAIYSFALYPSIYHKSFSKPWSHDLLKQLLLVAEKHGLKVIPELHPRADELSWPFLDAPEPKPHLLVSRDGQTRKDLPPFFNPLHPENRKWFLGMAGELTERYSGYPALSGVSLRLMQWKNPTLFNFHSLDWGYDDFTVTAFTRETGISIPGNSSRSERFRIRHGWLTTRGSEAWLEWRKEKVHELLSQLAAAASGARGDLKLFLPMFYGQQPFGAAWLAEAGVDPARINRIQSVEIVNALHSYGRRADERTNHELRRYLTDHARQRLLHPGDRNGAFLPGAAYFEATEVVAPPDKLGFPASSRKTWMSAVINPAGRNYLERFALLLADTDATLLADGGNAYTLGQPELREFLQEYRRLPAARFQLRTGPDSPVAVREFRDKDELIFYAVNRSPEARTATLTLHDGAGTRRQTPGEPVELKGSTLSIRLEPYQLLSYRSASSARIVRVEVR